MQFSLLEPSAKECVAFAGMCLAFAGMCFAFALPFWDVLCFCRAFARPSQSLRGKSVFFSEHIYAQIKRRKHFGIRTALTSMRMSQPKTLLHYNSQSSDSRKRGGVRRDLSGRLSQAFAACLLESWRRFYHTCLTTYHHQGLWRIAHFDRPKKSRASKKHSQSYPL